MTCNKIHEPLVVLPIFGKCYDAHNNVAYKLQNYHFFTPEMRYQSNLNII